MVSNSNSQFGGLRCEPSETFFFQAVNSQGFYEVLSSRVLDFLYSEKIYPELARKIPSRIKRSHLCYNFILYSKMANSVFPEFRLLLW